MANKSQQLTPMMRQYLEIKSRYPDRDTILFFRLGDFYEMFFEDAEVASRILDIALTSRNKHNEQQVPLCGIPYHAADQYISKLLAGGKKVAICEQVEDPAKAKGIVKRDVIRVVTPGVITELTGLEAKRHNYLVSVGRSDDRWGFAVIDVTTGLFKATELETIGELASEISKLEPAEVLVSRSLAESGLLDNVLTGVVKTTIDDPKFDPTALQKILSEDDISKLLPLGRSAAGAIYYYICYAAPEVIKFIKGIGLYETRKFMVLDEAARRNLELSRTMIDGSRYGSLLWLLDRTITPMGARLIREWVYNPLTDEAGIGERLDAVQTLKDDIALKEDISRILAGVSDVERIAGKVAMETASARELVALKESLKVIPQLFRYKERVTGLLKCIFSGIDTGEDVVERIEKTVTDEPPLSLKEGGLIRPGVSTALDELRTASRDGKGFIAGLERVEREKTGIGSLKVRYNRVFGYYIEVTNTHKDRVPETYIRKQTLANAERYITPELKEYEEKVLGAEERIRALEYNIFSELRQELTAFVPAIKKTAELLAQLDVLLALAVVAHKNRYTRPHITGGDEIEIKEGRHPIIERVNTQQRFVPNDICLNNTTDRLLIITGPNMAGKSTVMRQVALIVLMAQIGSFVPAEEAKIGIVDRIFTRVGASDNIMRGQSTFMVEMKEAAGILTEATNRSLIIIDEIGRGTSTFDGVAIAWAVAEYIHDKIKAKTLFATHYHELTDLVLTKKSAKNFNIAVKEWNGRVIFLHKLVTGGVSHSYGIQVAKLAGLPDDVITRAKEVLTNLEAGEFDEVGKPKLARSKTQVGAKDTADQLQLFHK